MLRASGDIANPQQRNDSFPGQEHVAGNSKIPSIMYYDQDGQLRAAGAEAESASIIVIAEDEGWMRAELYVRAVFLIVPLSPHALLLKVSSSGCGRSP